MTLSDAESEYSPSDPRKCSQTHKSIMPPLCLRTARARSLAQRSEGPCPPPSVLPPLPGFRLHTRAHEPGNLPKAKRSLQSCAGAQLQSWANARNQSRRVKEGLDHDRSQNSRIVTIGEHGSKSAFEPRSYPS